MAKGFYTQTGVVLFDRPPAVEALRAALAPSFEVVRSLDGGWSLMDTVGNWQLDLPDMEAAFPKASHDPRDVDEFLRNATDYHRERGAGIVKDGETMDLPGRPPWRGQHFEDSLTSPPRRVLRWIPADAPDVPRALLGR